MSNILETPKKKKFKSNTTFNVDATEERERERQRRFDFFLYFVLSPLITKEVREERRVPSQWRRFFFFLSSLSRLLLLCAHSVFFSLFNPTPFLPRFLPPCSTLDLARGSTRAHARVSLLDRSLEWKEQNETEEHSNWTSRQKEKARREKGTTTRRQEKSLAFFFHRNQKCAAKTTSSRRLCRPGQSSTRRAFCSERQYGSSTRRPRV